jgi:hypothetical protein
VRKFGKDPVKSNVVDEMLRLSEHLIALKMLAKMRGGFDAKKNK